MPRPKSTEQMEVISFSCSPALKAEIERAVEEEAGAEEKPNFSLWMRDAARKKLKRKTKRGHVLRRP